MYSLAVLWFYASFPMKRWTRWSLVHCTLGCSVFYSSMVLWFCPFFFHSVLLPKKVVLAHKVWIHYASKQFVWKHYRYCHDSAGSERCRQFLIFWKGQELSFIHAHLSPQPAHLRSEHHCLNTDVLHSQRNSSAMRHPVVGKCIFK